ncbi:MAG: hypothetical protein A2Y82_02635 [Candidatus Buchananbacteria bacterium RBG_13_36_9]|uniref:Uncharacterized protein n=1 Tax=Candidatus Buchananbacteria bacterium RBG_13_36_9 TaxID=1797530 RepID=A0A1G1XNW7_9BACT|nr:MAG: hypothetical protein A2Y82_02635 [Candidatus Buchananbacteria bacterium RBG_13_36_9]
MDQRQINKEAHEKAVELIRSSNLSRMSFETLVKKLEDESHHLGFLRGDPTGREFIDKPLHKAYEKYIRVIKKELKRRYYSRKKSKK